MNINVFLTTLGFARTVLLVGLCLGLAGALAQPACAQAEGTASSNQASSAAAIPLQTTTVPYTPQPVFGTILVTMRLNDRLNVTCVLDTGTINLSVSQHVADELGATLTPAIVNGKPMTFMGKPENLFQPTLVQVGTLRFRGAPTIVLPDGVISTVLAQNAINVDAQQYVGGIIGANMLGFFAVSLDTDQHSVTLWLPGNLSPKQIQEAGFGGPGVMVIPLTRASDLLYHVQAQLTEGGTSRAIGLMLDTGSANTMIFRDTAHQLGLKPDMASRVIGSFNGNFDIAGAKVDQMQIGDLSLPDFPVWWPKSSDYATVLGRDVFAHRRVLMDFPAGKMYLAPASPAPGAATSATAPSANTAPPPPAK